MRQHFEGRRTRPPPLVAGFKFLSFKTFRWNVLNDDTFCKHCHFAQPRLPFSTDCSKETLINTFQPFFKMYSKSETRTFFKTAKRTLRFNQRFPNINTQKSGHDHTITTAFHNYLYIFYTKHHLRFFPVFYWCLVL